MKLNPHVSVDCVVFGFDDLSLKVLLIDRNMGLPSGQQIHPKSLKLPGSLVFDDEDVDNAAVRVLKDLTGLENIYLQQFHVFGSPDRLDKKEDLGWLQKTTNMTINRVVTIAFFSLIKIHKSLTCDGKVVWQDIKDLPDLAFDHKEIILKGLFMLHRELQHEPVVFELLPKKFTIRQLQTLYEIILSKQLDNRNFRKSISKWGYVIPVGEKEQNVAHKPAQLFRFDKRLYNKQKRDYLSDN